MAITHTHSFPIVTPISHAFGAIRHLWKIPVNVNTGYKYPDKSNSIISLKNLVYNLINLNYSNYLSNIQLVIYSLSVASGCFRLLLAFSGCFWFSRLLLVFGLQPSSTLKVASVALVLLFLGNFLFCPTLYTYDTNS